MSILVLKNRQSQEQSQQFRKINLIEEQRNRRAKIYKKSDLAAVKNNRKRK